MILLHNFYPGTPKLPFDSSYVLVTVNFHCHHFYRRLNKRLAQLGSSELIPIGLGDDQSKYGYCTELDLWVAKLLTSIKSRRKYQDMIALEESAGASIAIAHYLVTVLPSITAADEIKLEDQIFKQSDYRAHDLKVLQSRFVPPESHKPNRSQMISGAGEFLPIVGYVRENKRITRDGWSQDVRHVVISFNSAFIQTPAGISDVDEEIELFHSATTDNMTDTGIAALPSEMPSFNNTISPYVSPICESPVSTAQLSHTAGDVATIYPLNHALLVTRMIAILNRSTHNPGIYTENDTKYTTSTLISLRCLPGFVKRRSRITEFECCSLGRLFSSFMDVAGMPQRGFFEGLALYTENTDEKEKLLEIASAEGTDLYYDYCVKEKRNYIEVLEDFKTAKPSLSQILELIPVLQPRHYSIANSGMVENNEIHLCVAVVSTKTPYGRERTGVCSGYISSLALNDQVLLYIRSGSLRLPSPPSYSINTNSADTSNDPNIENSERNDLKIVTAMKNVDSPSNVSLPKMILIGPGTGIAPMRALIRERKYVFQRMKQMNSASDIESNNTSFNHTLLFFGCRNRDNDFLYGEEWTTLKTSSRITGNNSVVDNYGTQDPDAFVGSSESVIVAFSRDQKDKVYVTDKIKQHGQLVWSHINEV